MSDTYDREQREQYIQKLRLMQNSTTFYAWCLAQLRAGDCLQYRIYYDYIVESQFTLAMLGTNEVELVACALRCNTFTERFHAAKMDMSALMIEHGLQHALERMSNKTHSCEKVISLVPTEEAA